jgi:hypothetical protein
MSAPSRTTSVGIRRAPSGSACVPRESSRHGQGTQNEKEYSDCKQATAEVFCGVDRLAARGPYGNGSLD